MKKVGIVTMYTDSCNMGGLLQSKALVKVLESFNCRAEQISIGSSEKGDKDKTVIKKSLNIIREKGIDGFLYTANQKIKRKKQAKEDIKQKKYKIEESERKKLEEKCKEYRDSIPHTKVFYKENEEELNDIFDMFVVGSDQVWNPKYFREEYLLEFAKKRKIAYAASIARYDFSRYEKRRFRRDIKDFSWISVREKEAKEFLNTKFNIMSEHVLDPTMLITKEEWEKEEKSLEIKEKYVFCYFLHPTEEKRNYVKKFGKDNGLKIIYPAFVALGMNYDDEKAGEQIIYDSGPREWLYLIHNAEYVLTDSFHGTVFSIIYEKNFSHILRDKKNKTGNMNSRIDSLLKMFGLEEQVINCEDNTEKKKINYANVRLKLEKERKKSINVLKNAIKKDF